MNQPLQINSELLQAAMTLYLERVADRDDRGCQKPYRSLGRHLELNR
jgi:hypothetical protein